MRDQNSDIKPGISQDSLLPEISVRFLAVAGLFLICLFGFGFIVHEIVLEKEDVFDARIVNMLSAYSTEPVIQFMKFFTFFGSTTFLIPAYMMVIGLLLMEKRRKHAINVGVIGVSSTALMYFLKQVFHRNRPDLPLIESLKTYSFPSGHALSSFIFCCMIIYLVWNGKASLFLKWCVGVLLIFLSVIIGLSRIMLHVHYPSDVIASFCLGFVWVCLSFWIQGKLHTGRHFSRLKFNKEK